MQMRNKVISLLYLAMLLAGCSSADDAPPDHPAHTAAIVISGENPYKALRLTPEIYNAANSDLSDLLIKNSKGDRVPYFINAGAQNSSAWADMYAMTLTNSYLKDHNFYFDYKLAAPRSSDTIATSIEFTTGNTNFAKTVDVYGSYDDIHWDFVQQDTLYSIDGKSRLAIMFAQPLKFTHYRLVLANNLEQIAFDTVHLAYSVTTSEKTYFIENLTPAFHVESGDRSTAIRIQGLKNLRLCDIAIHTDSMFMRNARVQYGRSKEIYNLSLNGTSYADTTIPLDWSSSQNEIYTITMDDGDDKPINVNGLTVRYYADELVFEGSADETYTLEFSGDPTAIAPVYDIARYKDDVLKGAIDKAAIGEIHYETAAIRAPRQDYRLIFNIVIVVVTLFLGTVIVLKLKKKP